MHPPKAARYDLTAGTHTVSQGVYPVEVYEQGDGWLYLARPLVGHPRIAAMEAYLLPALGVQVNRWDYRPGGAYDGCDFYIDIMTFEVYDTYWTSRDLYLDVVLSDGKAARILDTDEFLAAQTEGLLTSAEVTEALSAAHALLNGLAEHAYRLHDHLETRGLTLTWHR